MLRHATLALSIFVVLSALGCGNKSDKKDRPEAVEKGPTAQEFFLAGNKEFEERNWEGAIREYERAVDRDPKRWDIFMNKAIAHSRAAQFEEALGSIEQAFANGGASEPEVYFNLGNIYQERGMYPEALVAYRTGLSHRDGTHVESLINIGSCYVFLRQYEEAIATYEHLKSVAPDNPASTHGLALVAQLRQNYEKALEFYEEVHAMDPDFANSYFNRGSLLGKMERYDEAITAFNDYLRYAPDGPYAKRARNQIERYQSLKAE